MKIKYNRKKILVNLFLSLLYLTFGVVILLTWNEEEKLLYKIMALLLVAVKLPDCLYYCIFPYLTIKNGILKETKFFGEKTVVLSEVKQIEKTSKKYILKTDKKDVKINTKIISKDSLTALNSELEKLNIEWI